MSVLGIEITKFSWIGAVGMTVFGIIDSLTVKWGLAQGERQARQDGTLGAEKAQAFQRVRTVLAVICFLCFPVIGLLAGNAVIGSFF